jgi:anti-sigma factor RsiW
MDEKKSLEQSLELMAHLDGVESAGRRKAVEAWLAADPAAVALRDELSWVRQAVRSHEPLGQVPDSREFYWSQIRRRIEQADAVTAAAARPSRSRFADWMAWLVPVTGVAAVTLLATLHPWQSGSATSGVTEASAMTYTSETDGVTIHWID